MNPAPTPTIQQSLSYQKKIVLFRMYNGLKIISPTHRTYDPSGDHYSISTCGAHFIFVKKQIDDKVMALARSGSYTLNPLPPLSHARDVTSRVYRSQREGLSSAPF